MMRVWASGFAAVAVWAGAAAAHEVGQGTDPVPDPGCGGRPASRRSAFLPPASRRRDRRGCSRRAAATAYPAPADPGRARRAAPAHARQYRAGDPEARRDPECPPVWSRMPRAPAISGPRRTDAPSRAAVAERHPGDQPLRAGDAASRLWGRLADHLRGRQGAPWPIASVAYDPRLFAQDGTGCGQDPRWERRRSRRRRAPTGRPRST